MGSSIASHGVLPGDPPQDVWTALFSGWSLKDWPGLTKVYSDSVDMGT